MKKWTSILSILAVALAACGQTSEPSARLFNDIETNKSSEMNNVNADFQTATFGAGCFWCIEAVFQRLEGVESVTSGYSGGTVRNPTYREVTSGRTGHAEVAQIVYNAEKISFDELLEVFWQTHDPTTLNRQGADVGSQYRSAIFFHNEVQREKAIYYKEQLNARGAFDKPIVTEIAEFDAFYPAENYHQNYYNLNSNQPYCSYVIDPKVDKLKKVFADKMKEEYK